MRVCVICICVHDMDAALDFYCGKLGFEVEDRKDYPAIVQLRHDGVPLILQATAEAPASRSPKDSRTVLDFEVPDLTRAMRSLKAKGVPFVHDTPQDCPVGVYAAFHDPSGNVHELLEFREPA